MNCCYTVRRELKILNYSLKNFRALVILNLKSTSDQACY